MTGDEPGDISPEAMAALGRAFAAYMNLVDRAVEESCAPERMELSLAKILAQPAPQAVMDEIIADVLRNDEGGC